MPGKREICRASSFLLEHVTQRQFVFDRLGPLLLAVGDDTLNWRCSNALPGQFFHHLNGLQPLELFLLLCHRNLSSVSGLVRASHIQTMNMQ